MSVSEIERQVCAVIAGGSRGIGRAICSALAPAYETIAILYRSNTEAAETVAREVAQHGARPLLLRADVRDPDATRDAIGRAEAAAGRIDLLVHSAGGSSSWKTVRDLTHREWAEIIDLDLNGFFNTASPTLAVMHRQRAGAIV